MTGRVLLLPIALGAMLIWGAGATAQQADDLSAAVHSGTCDNLGDEVASLNNPRLDDDDDWVGVEGLGTVLESETDDVARGQDLLGAPHSIVVFVGADAVACGEIGGYLDDEDLSIGLQPVSDSGYFGIAHIDDLDDDDDDDDDDDEVEIDLYVFRPAE